MARSLMTFLCVMLMLAYHLSYCLLHLHIHFDSHTQRCRHASDYFARVGCRALNPSHFSVPRNSRNNFGETNFFGKTID